MSEEIKRKDTDTTDNTSETMKLTDANMATMIYFQLHKFFGGGSQLFSMEFPCRVLNRLDYAYPIDDYNSSALRKPYVVAENEFRLSDNMIDLSPIVQGPNGKYLSKLYNTAINNYTPKIDDLKDFVIDKMELRLFLMEKITDEIGGETVTCSRMEFCQKTYLKYLENKYKWDQEKIEKHETYNEQNDLDGYAKWLATTSWTKDHELETLFNDAIVRGFYHEVMTILGFLDIASPAERLSTAKSNKRSSVRRTVDCSDEALPVSFQPSNWFRSLMPNYSPQDLTLDASYLGVEYQSKKALLTSLEAELRTLLSISTSSEDVDALKQTITSLENSMDEYEKTYFKEYTQAQIEAIKLAFEIASKGDMLGFISSGAEGVVSSLSNVLNNTNYLNLFGISTTSDDKSPIESLINSVYTMYNAHIDYFSAYNKLVQTELELATAETTDYEDQIQILKEKINILSKELEQISVVLASDAVNNSTSGVTSSCDLLPVSKYDEDTVFTDIVFGVEETYNSVENSQKSAYFNFSGSVGNWFVNSSVKGQYAASESAFIQEMKYKDITIGMRVTKVTIDRGGWFDPTIFDISGSYMKLNKKISAGAGLSADDIMETFEKMSTESVKGKSIQDMLKYTVDNTEGTYILPAYPTSFLIAKDVVIKFSGVEENKADFQSFRETVVNTTSHIFGFKISGGGSSRTSMGYSQDSTGTTSFYIRIPGPQILGWFSEMTPKDNAEDYQSLSKSGYFTEIMDALREYREKLNNVSYSDSSDACSYITTNVEA